MPFVANMDNEEQKTDPSVAPQGAVAPVGGGAAVRLSPSSAVSPTGSAGTPGAAGAPSTPTAGGQFGSLQSYLAANQGQAEPLAGKITTGIGQQYNTLQGQNQATLGNINQQVAANAIPGASDTLAQEAANPVSFASNPSNIPSFQKLLGATYSGPTSAESTAPYQAQQAAINNAISQGQNATKTEAGRENLLQQNEATPTAGVTALNSAILSQSPTALGSVEKAYDPYANLLSSLSSGAQATDTNIAQTQSDVAAANSKANEQIASQINGLNTNVNQELSKATADRDAYNAAVAQNQNVWNPVNTQINSINELLSGVTNGLTPVAGGATSIANPLGQYVNAPISATAPTLQTVATPQEYAQAQAFQNLLSGLNTGIAAPTLDPTLASQAGTYTAPTAPTISNPKAEAKTLFDEMNQTISVPVKQPDGSTLLVANPWTNAANQNGTWSTTFDPQYANLQNLLNKIYGGNLYSTIGQ